MIKVVGTIGGVQAVFLVDSGATTEFVDEEFVRRARVHVTEQHGDKEIEEMRKRLLAL